jgi:hypothetical protein
MPPVSAEDSAVNPQAPVKPETSVKPQTPVQPPEAPAATPVTRPASGKQGFVRRLWGKLNSPGPLKLAAIIFTALVGFFFGIASNQMTDFIKRADNCYDALSVFNDNIYQETIDIIADVHSQVGQTSESAYTKFRTDIEIPYNKITGICPVARRDTQYLNKSDIDAFLNDYHQFAGSLHIRTSMQQRSRKSHNIKNCRVERRIDGSGQRRFAMGIAASCMVRRHAPLVNRSAGGLPTYGAVVAVRPEPSTCWRVQHSVDDNERQALQAEGFNAEDPAVIAAIDLCPMGTLARHLSVGVFPSQKPGTEKRVRPRHDRTGTATTGPKPKPPHLVTLLFRDVPRYR